MSGVGIFLAGSCSVFFDRERLIGYEQRLRSRGLRNRLIAFEPEDAWQRNAKIIIDVYRDDGQIILDSGAYTAHSMGTPPPTLDEYAEFILEYGSAFVAVANLDLIPGEPGIKS